MDHDEVEALHPQHATGSVPVVARPRTPAGRARRTADRLAEAFPGTARDLCALDHADPFQLLAATILSAQCTDERVNRTTPALFARYPDPYALAAAELRDVEAIIRSTGFFRAKAQSLVGMASAVVDRFGGQVPSAMPDLVTLPGVGRKTANVVRSVAFGLPGLPVDTHVQRLSARLGLTEETDPVRVETALNAMIPASQRGSVQPPADPARASHLHGATTLLRALHPRRLLPFGRCGNPRRLTDARPRPPCRTGSRPRRSGAASFGAGQGGSGPLLWRTYCQIHDRRGGKIGVEIAI